MLNDKILHILIIIPMINYDDDLILSKKVKKCLSFDPFIQNTTNIDGEAPNNSLLSIQQQKVIKI